MNNENQSTKEIDFRKAFAKAKKAFKPVKASHENPFYNSKYADLSDYHRATDEALLDNGFTIHQLFESNDAGNYLVTKLSHLMGHSEISRIRIVSKDDSDPQKVGSALTYYRRYALSAILAIPSEDDDGNTASTSTDASTPRKTFKTITEKQANRFNAIARTHGWSQPQLETILKSKGYSVSSEIKPEDYEELCQRVSLQAPRSTHKDFNEPPPIDDEYIGNPFAHK